MQKSYKDINKRNKINFTESVCSTKPFLIIRLFLAFQYPNLDLYLKFDSKYSLIRKTNISSKYDFWTDLIKDLLAKNLDEYSASRVCVRQIEKTDWSQSYKVNCNCNYREIAEIHEEQPHLTNNYVLIIITGLASGSGTKQNIKFLLFWPDFLLRNNF